MATIAAQSTRRLLLVDDEVELLEVLQPYFEARAFAVSTATDAVAALRLLYEHPFDIMVTDLRLPGMSGVQLQVAAREVRPDLAVVFLSGQGTMGDAIAAMREHGAFDFLTKPLGSVHQLHLIIEKALTSAAERARAPAAPEPVAAAWSTADLLTLRELQVLRLLAEGHSNEAISHVLTLSAKTVKSHLAHIYEKLNAENRTQAVVFGQKLGLV